MDVTSFVQRAPAGFDDLDFGNADDLDFAAPEPQPAMAPTLSAVPVAEPAQPSRQEHSVAYRRARSRQEILTVIDRMVTVFKDPRRGDLDRLPDLYDLSNELYNLAGALQLKVMTRSAFIFCTLTDRMRLARRWDHTSVAVFIEAFRRLHVADDDSPLAGRILEGLRRVADKANPYAVT
jgi:hypothetical protein